MFIPQEDGDDVPPRASESGETAALDLVTLRGARDAPLPSGWSEAELTIQQYANLCAELERAPSAEQQEATFRRYGVADRDALTRLHTNWRARFARDPGMQRLFELLYDQHASSGWSRGWSRGPR